MVWFDSFRTRIRRRLQVHYERTRYRLGLPEPDPGQVFIAHAFRHPIDATQKLLLTCRYRELFPDAVQSELAEARRLAAHRFTFLGHTVEHGERIAWSRDPVSGREWTRDFSPDIPYRGPERLGDIKLPWELNKHQYFFTLGKAAWLTDDPSPAVEIVRQIDQWIEDNPSHHGINWISALEVGTRAVSWIMAYPFYADHCDASFRHRLARSLAQHMFFVEGHLSTGRFANNHLIGDAAALVAGGLFLDSRQSRRWVEKGVALLEQEMQRQVSPDGVHVERSVAYHRFVLDQYHLVSGLLAPNGRSLSAATRKGMERMTDFLMDILSPDGSAPAFGDGDDARGLWFRADCPADFRSPLALGAVFFGRGDFKTIAGGLTEEVLWLLGDQGVAKFQGLAARPPDHTSAAYGEGGYYVMRGGWGASDPVLAFDCGPLGHGPAGHGHADALSFQLHAGRYPFLVDPGAFSYNLDYQWRDAFRSTRAHNTIVVDGLDQSVPRDRMSWSRTAESRSRRWLSTYWFDLADGEHDGYRRLLDPVTHRRVVIYLKPDLWIIQDHLLGKSRHDLELLMHLRPDCAVEIAKGRTSVVLQSPQGARLHTWMPGTSGDTILPDVLVGTDEQRTAWFSAGYGTRVASRALSFRREFVGACTVTTCISASSRLSPTFTEQEGVLGVSVRRRAELEESLLYRPDPHSTAKLANGHFDGTLLFQHRLSGVPPAVWASQFTELSLEGLLDVRAPTIIDSLALEGERCEVVVAADHVGGLQFRARDGVRLVINGRPHRTC